jgi:hypothetical protein
MLQLTSPQPQSIPAGHDITITVSGKDTSGIKEYIRWILRSAVHCEYRKYLKAKRLLSAGPSFSHTRCIHFVLEQPNPQFDDVITYRLHFSAAGVVIEPVSPNPDPDIATLPEHIDFGMVQCEKAPVIAMPETRHIVATRMPSIPAEQDERPQFRFGGKYLEKYGFTIGTPVTVYLEQNKIILTVTAEDQLNKELA